MQAPSIIITGASSGVGENLAKDIGSKYPDAKLVLISRNENKLKEISDSISCDTYVYPYDLNDLEHIKDIFLFCQRNNIMLNGMVHCAGMDTTCPVKMNNVNKMQEIMNVNCFSFVEMSKYFYSKRFSTDGASIVAISSIASVRCDIGMVAYSTSKAALNAAVKTISREFVRRKIRVNAILPAGISTLMADEKSQLLYEVSGANINETKVMNSNMEQPLGMIDANSVVRQIEFLLSSEAKYTTGSLINISAGMFY